MSVISLEKILVINVNMLKNCLYLSQRRCKKTKILLGKQTPSVQIAKKKFRKEDGRIARRNVQRCKKRNAYIGQLKPHPITRLKNTKKDFGREIGEFR